MAAIMFINVHYVPSYFIHLKIYIKAVVFGLMISRKRCNEIYCLYIYYCLFILQLLFKVTQALCLNFLLYCV